MRLAVLTFHPSVQQFAIKITIVTKDMCVSAENTAGTPAGVENEVGVRVRPGTDVEHEASCFAKSARYSKYTECVHSSKALVARRVATPKQKKQSCRVYVSCHLMR